MKKHPKRRRLTGPIHARIEKFRTKLDLTQEELATALGVDKTAVSHWENGFSRPDMARLTDLAKALGVSIEDLVDGERAA